MLQPYSKQEDIPEALREHYSKREDGQWHADIPDQHPAVKHNAKLLSEKQAAESKVTQLTSDLESARAGNLGRGQVAATKSDMALLDEYKVLGTPAELKTRTEEHATLKEKDTKRVREDSLRQLAKDGGYNEDAFIRLPGLPEFTSRAGKDGKTEWFAQIKDDKGVITEKPAKEFIESSADIKPFMASLTQKPAGVQVPGSVMVTAPAAGDPYKWATDYANNYVKESQPVADPFKEFSQRSSI